MDKLDVIVLGTSLDGLATAALCSKFGLKTAIVGHKNRSQNDFENIADAIQYRWDAGIGVFAQILKILEIKNEIHFTQPEYIDEVQLDDFSIARKFGWMNYQQQLIDLFPSEKDSIKAFFSELYDIGQEWLLLLQTGSILSVKKMMKYRDTIYTDFVLQHFSDPIIINLLNIDNPRTAVTLPVMAGYITTQVFDCHVLKHSYAELFLIFTQNIQKNGGSVLLHDEIFEISRNEIEDKFIIKTKDSVDYTCSWLVSTYDETNTYKTYFSEVNTKGIDARLFDPLSIITAKIKIDKTQSINISKQFYLYRSPVEPHTGIENGIGKPFSRIRMFNNSHYMFIQGEFLPEFDEIQCRESIQEIAAANLNIPAQSFNQIAWITADDIETHFGYSKGFIHRWAFRKNETPLNPFSHTTEIKNLLTTGHWGTAWFTAAITASRFVKQNIKNLVNER